MTKAIEICGEDNKIIYQGYERSLLMGFGGKVWYQCLQDNIWWQFAITRRINNPELQVYYFEQRTKFPNNFEINP